MYSVAASAFSKLKTGGRNKNCVLYCMCGSVSISKRSFLVGWPLSGPSYLLPLTLALRYRSFLPFFGSFFFSYMIKVCIFIWAFISFGWFPQMG